MSEDVGTGTVETPDVQPMTLPAPPPPGPPTPGVVRMTIGPEVVAMVLGSIAVGVLAFGVAVAARRILGWAVAAAIVAALLEPFVERLDRYLPRVVAILTGLLLVGVVAGSVATGILADLGNQFDRLRDEAPRAADELEDSDRFGELAQNFRLEERVDTVLDRLRDPTSGVASEKAASAAGAYLVGAVLTAFLLSSGPKMGEAALLQVADATQREHLRQLVRTGFARGRTYVLFGLAKAAVVGSVGWALCYWQDVPAPIVLGVAVAALSVVPGFGVLVAGIFAVLLEAGLGTVEGVIWLAVAFVLLQAADVVFVRRIVIPRSLSVGPAVVVIAVIVGFEVYGIGGALFAAVLAIFAIAMLDAAGGIIEAAESQPPSQPSTTPPDA
ncbi:MAG TPA: AI-2E family transporter [Acidimicrobiales bacterium]|nr:AI-2E family transporter [Acidimicrobiales bacterium]